jgi:hypothetical protein
MGQPFFLAILIALGVLLALGARRIPTALPACLLLLCGVAVFAVRLHHAGPYPFPRGPDLVFGPANLLLGLLALRPWRPSLARGALGNRLLLAVMPFVLFLGLGAVAHEAEEVVILRTANEAGAVRDTRLWVIDQMGSPWVVTARHSDHIRELSANPRVEVFRRGEWRCHLAEPHGDRETIEASLRLRHEKYRVQRLAVALGVWPSSLDGIEEVAVAVRFEPCPPATSR